MIINKIPLYNSYLFRNKSQETSFGSNGRSYQTPEGESMGCISWMFRDDLDWKKYSLYLLSHFKNTPKVNTVMFAASDGSEAYSLIIALIEYAHSLETAKKFFPIKAYDLDKEIVKAAQSGLLNTDSIDRMNMQMNCMNYEDYFSFVNDKLHIDNNVLVERIQRPKTLQAKHRLTDNVIFNQGNMFTKLDKIQDKSNTLLMCRNVLGYFENDVIEDFVKKVSKKLKT